MYTQYPQRATSPAGHSPVVVQSYVPFTQQAQPQYQAPAAPAVHQPVQNNLPVYNPANPNPAYPAPPTLMSPPRHVVKKPKENRKEKFMLQALGVAGTIWTAGLGYVLLSYMGVGV